MSLFSSGLQPRTMSGVVPYYPTPDERATSIPATPTARPAPRGMFGAPMVPGGGNSTGPVMSQPYAQAEGAVGPLTGTAEARPSPIFFDVDLPQAKLDLSSLAAPIDMSNFRIRKPGFFQHGGLGEKLLKGFGEWGLRYSASQGDPYALMVLRNRFEQQQAPIRAQEEARRRQQEREEWMWREDYKRSHPDDQFTQYMQAAGIDPRSPQGQALYRQRAESMATPPMMAVDGFDAQGNPTKTFMPRAGIGGMGSQGAPSGPVPGTVRNGYRFKGGNPNDRNSWVPVGGASPAGGATFR